MISSLNFRPSGDRKPRSVARRRREEAVNVVAGIGVLTHDGSAGINAHGCGAESIARKINCNRLGSIRQL